MPDPAEKKSLRINIRAPSFQRRFIASQTDDLNTLVALASDESYFVRRQAVQNPNTPRWILDLLVRAGATPDLRGKSEIDPDLDSHLLRRLVETGPWARQLVAEHPNTSAEVLSVLKDQPSIPLRLAVATHLHVNEATLAGLCCDIEAAIRAKAVANPNCPPALIEMLVAAGAIPDLQGVRREYGEMSAAQLTRLVDLGAWGCFLAARHPGSPEALLAAIAHDPDWRVRSGLLDNPNTPETVLLAMFDAPAAGDVETIKRLSQSHLSRADQSQLAKLLTPEVRLSLARHPAAMPDILGLLATDGVKEIRGLAASHTKTRTADLHRLVRAGSTPDMMGLSEPDLTMTTVEIHALLDGGVWARQLIVRHPNSDAVTLAHLLCDREPKIREWAAVHPNLSPETKQNLLRAGSGSDFQGIAPPDPELSSDVLRYISTLGPWGECVVVNNPHAPIDLLDSLANSDDWQVRLSVAQNPGTSSTTLARLANDPVEEVRKIAFARFDRPGQA